MAIKDYANKKRRKVGNRTSRYNSDREVTNILRANRNNRSRSGSMVSSPLFTMVIFISIIFGGAILYLEYFQDIADNLLKSVHSSKQAKTAQKKSAPLKPIVTAEKKIPKFEFYHTLPKMSVVSNKITNPVPSSSTPVVSHVPSKPTIDLQVDRPQEQIPNSLAKYEIDSIPELLQQQEKSKSTPTPTIKKEQYFLQIASFKNIKDAEALKAKLILAGFTVSIQSAKLPNGQVWYRVKSNKIQNIELALNLHSQLKVHQIESIILTEKG